MIVLPAAYLSNVADYPAVARGGQSPFFGGGVFPQVTPETPKKGDSPLVVPESPKQCDSPRAQTITELRSRLSRWERPRQKEMECRSTGCDALDALFPERGVRRGSLVEWVEDGAASGAATMAMFAGRQLSDARRAAIFVDFKRQVYPPALAASGFDLAKMIIVRPSTEQETLWACEESLRCKAVALVWTRIERLTGLAFRRLQLAAEESDGIGFLVRSAAALRQPSWADVRFVVTPRPAAGEWPRFQVKVAYSRGKTRQPAAEVEIDVRRGTIHGVTGQRNRSRGRQEGDRSMFSANG
jgi:protein ImuA